jgi:hypothetical protein
VVLGVVRPAQERPDLRRTGVDRLLLRAGVAEGGVDAAPRLASFVLVNRCDPGAAGPTVAALEALVAIGGPAGREVLAFVAADTRTAPEVAARARAKLEGP